MLTEKYRPESLDDVVGQEEIVSKLKKKLRKKPSQIPHLLFYGKSGVGKTTVAQAMARDLDAGFLEFNASDQRGIDDIRENIIPAMANNFYQYKIIFLDESDMLTNESQMALRRPLEKFQKPIVILSCNEKDRLKDYIISRLQTYKFEDISKNKIKERLNYIKKEESFDGVDVDEIAEESNGDLRKAINLLDRGSGGNGKNSYMNLAQKYVKEEG